MTLVLNDQAIKIVRKFGKKCIDKTKVWFKVQIPLFRSW